MYEVIACDSYEDPTHHILQFIERHGQPIYVYPLGDEMLVVSREPLGNAVLKDIVD